MASTSAHSAPLLPTAHSPARPNPPWPLVTPLILERWHHYLSKHDLLEKHAKTLNDIEFGFSYHSSIQISESRIFPNQPFTIQNPEVIDKVIESELEAGRYFGPYTLPEIEAILGPIICHPIGVIDKVNGKKRLIEDLSFPRDGSFPSLNSLTDISHLHLDWGGLAEMTHLVVSAKPGTRGATLDWLNAYQNCAVRRDELWLGCIHWHDVFYVDNSLKFGGKSPSHEFEGPSSAFTDVATAKGLGDFIHWVDNDEACQEPTNNSPPYTYAFSTDDIIVLGKELGITFPPEKVSPFSFQSKYFGFIWHWDLKEVRIPEDKRVAVQEALVIAKELPKVSLATLHSLCGKLSHFSMVVPEGRSRMRGLWQRLAKMEAACKSPNTSWSWSPSQTHDLDWWESTLASPNVGMKLCTHPTPDKSLPLFCEASTSWGIGIVIGNRFDRFKLLPGWDSPSSGSRSIGWAEFAAVELLISSLQAYLGSERFKD
jgi:hypothetical protein